MNQSIDQSERIVITILKLVKRNDYTGFNLLKRMTERDSCAEEIKQFLFDSTLFVEK